MVGFFCFGQSGREVHPELNEESQEGEQTEKKRKVFNRAGWKPFYLIRFLKQARVLSKIHLACK